MSSTRETPGEAHLFALEGSARARAIRRAAAALGRPPSAAEASEYSSHPANTWSNYRGPWDTILRDEAGLPGHADVVARDIRERFESRRDWQDRVRFRAAAIADSTGLFAGRVGLLLAAIGRGERTPAAMDGLTLGQRGADSSPRLWEVRGR